MANLSHIARPYALAAFECARDKEQLPAWKAFLETAANVARAPQIQQVLANPELATVRVTELFEAILTTQLDTERKNFLRLLAQNKRLIALPEIADAFNAAYAQLEKVSNVRVITAVDIKDDYKHKLIQAFTRRIKHDVTLLCEVDPAIIGGAIFHIGDNVIDASIRGKLTRLLEFSLR